MANCRRAELDIPVAKNFKAAPIMPLEIGMLFCRVAKEVRVQREWAGYLREYYAMTRGPLKESLVPSKLFAFHDRCVKLLMTPSQIKKRLICLKRFSRWLSLRNDWPDTLSAVKLQDFKLNRRSFYRRFLSREEWEWLKKSLTLPEDYAPMVALPKTERIWKDPHQRFLIYSTAIQTGYRRSEMMALRWRDLTINGPDDCTLSLDGIETKNGKHARQYLTYELACQLKVFGAGKSMDDPIFPGLTHRAAEMFHEDLFRARKLWQSENPGVTDRSFLSPIDDKNRRLHFHSLRHTCGAWLALNGENVKDVQEVMRHSCITLTMNQYDHLFPGRSKRAVLNGFQKM